MSRTIKTKSGSDFSTNISSENLLGELCMIAKAPFFILEFYPYYYSLSYSMTKKETEETAKKLLGLLPNIEAVFGVVKHHFGEDSTPNDLIEFIEEYAKKFLESKGYKCIS